MKGIKKAALLFIGVLCCSIFALGLTGCGTKPAVFQDNPADDMDRYVEYVATARDGGVTPLLYGEWHDTVDTIANSTVSAYSVWKDEGVNKSEDVNSFIVAIQKKGVQKNGELTGKTINLSKTNIENGVITVCYSDGSSVKPAIDLGENFKERNSVGVTLTDSQILHFTFGEANVYADIYVSSVPVSDCSSHKYEKNEVFAHTSDAKDVKGEYGISYSACSVCGALKVELTTGHKFEETVKAPTCTEEGYSTFVCKQCGYESGKTDVTAKTEHDLVKHVVEPTCTEQGYTYYTCKNCDYKSEKSDYTDKLDHKKTTVIRYAHEDGRNECEDGRIQVTYCELCGKVFKAITLAAEGHHSVEWKVAKDPSNKNTGLLQGFCYKCHDEEATYVLPLFDPFKNNGAPYEWEFFGNGEKNCSSTLNVHYWITVDNQKFDFYNGEYYVGYHTLVNKFGKEYFKDGDTTVHTYIEDELTSGDRNIILFQNKPLTCSDKGDDAMFKCAVCGQDIVIKVRIYHEPGDNDAVYNKEYDCTAEKSGTFDCAKCGKTNANGPVGHDYQIKSIKAVSGGEYEVVIACAREKGDFNITIRTKNVERVGGTATCKSSADYNYVVKLSQTKDGCDYKVKSDNKFVENKCEIEDKYGRIFVGDIELTSEIFVDAIKPHKVDGKELDRKYYDPTYSENLPWLAIGGGIKAFGNSLPACTDKPVEGYFVCEDCGDMILVNVKTEHKELEGSQQIVKATCTADGYYKYTCAVCGEVVTKETYKKLGHKFEYTIDVDGEHYRISQFEVHCTRCDESCELGDDFTLPHITDKTVYTGNKPEGEQFYKKGKVIKAATCQEEGECYYSFVVVVDGVNVTVEFKGPDLKKAHEPYEDGREIEWELTINGTVYIYRGIICKNCNEIIEITYKAPKA